MVEGSDWLRHSTAAPCYLLYIGPVSCSGQHARAVV